jgi:hypothetical protein
MKNGPTAVGMSLFRRAAAHQPRAQYQRPWTPVLHGHVLDAVCALFQDLRRLDSIGKSEARNKSSLSKGWCSKVASGILRNARPCKALQGRVLPSRPRHTTASTAPNRTTAQSVTLVAAKCCPGAVRSAGRLNPPVPQRPTSPEANVLNFYADRDIGPVHGRNPLVLSFRRTFDLPELLRAIASRTSALKADSSTSSPSWMSIARHTFPSRLELNRPAGSCRDAPLAKVSFTIVL